MHAFEEAQGFRALLECEGAGYTVEKIAAKTGKAGAYIAKRLRLLALIPPVAEAFTAAHLLADATITLDGHPVACYVVKLSDKDLRKASKPGSSVEKTVWIDKATMAIRQIDTLEHMPNLFNPHLFQDVRTTDRYLLVDLDAQPKDGEFAFNPPQDSTMVQKFRSPFDPGEDLSGQPAPSVTFKSSDGKEISLAALKGKPVTIDFWATWCLPRIVSMPQMADLYQETKDKGLVFIGVDEDKDAKTAADYLTQKHETFPNFHDSGEIGKALKEAALPYTVLVDAQGKIVFSKTGYSDSSLSELRTAIAKLGLEFSSVSTQGCVKIGNSRFLEVPTKAVGTTKRKQRTEPPAALARLRNGCPRLFLQAQP